MMTFIEVGDIRKGDHIRHENPETLGSNTLAVEYRALRDGDNNGWASGTFYLVDRPERDPFPYDKPTLGWATWTEDWGTYLAVWAKNGDRIKPSADRFMIDGVLNDDFVEFVEAKAVNAEALDALRDFYRKYVPSGDEAEKFDLLVYGVLKGVYGPNLTEGIDE